MGINLSEKMRGKLQSWLRDKGQYQNKSLCLRHLVGWWADPGTVCSRSWHRAAEPDSGLSWSSERHSHLWQSCQRRWRRTEHCCSWWRCSWQRCSPWSWQTPLEKDTGFSLTNQDKYYCSWFIWSHHVVTVSQCHDLKVQYICQ